MNRIRHTTARALGLTAVSGVLLLGVASPASAETVTLSATGSGTNEVPPSSGEKGATVAGSFDVDTTSGVITYTVSAQGNAEPITAGHLHSGVTGANGPVVAPLDAAAITAGSRATVKVAPALAASIAANPAGFYLNVHSKSFAPPTGNARAQLVAGTGKAPAAVNAGSGGQFAADQGGVSTSTFVLGAGGALVLVGAAGAVAARRRNS